MTDAYGKKLVFADWRTEANGVRYLRLLERHEPGKVGVRCVYDGDRLARVVRADDGRTLFALHYQTAATGGALCEKITDHGGRVVASFAYDARELLTAVYHGDAAEATPHCAFAYDENHNMTQKTRANGGVVRYAWSGGRANFLERADLADGTFIKVDRAESGGVEKVVVTNRDGSKTEFTRLPYEEKFTEAKYPSGRRVRRAYDADNQLVEENGACPSCDGGKSVVARHVYDGQRRLVETKYYDAHDQFLASEKFTYHEDTGAYASVTAKDGAVTRYEHDAAGRQTKVVHPDGSARQTAYAPEGLVASETDELGRVTRYEHAADSVTRVDPDGAKTVTTLDAMGRTLRVTAPDGTVTTSAYDAMGHLAARTTAKGAFSKTERFAHDPHGNLLSYADAMGNVTRHEYNGQHQLVKTVYPDGSCVENTLDARDRVVKIKNRDGSVTAREYDFDGKVTAVVRADGRRSENGYNADGRLIWTKDFNGNVTSFEHDDWGNVVKAIDALGNVTTATFDAMGRRTSATDAMGATTKFAYDQRSRLISIIDPLGNETKMEHDAAGNLTKQVAPNGVVTLHEYDAMNREIKTIVNAADAANAIVSTREYDVAGRAVKTVQNAGEGRANLTNTMEYDAAGQLAKTTAPDGRVSEYGYDANGDRVSESVTTGGVTLTTRTVYDAMRRVVRVTGPDGLVTAYEHDALGRVVRTVADAEGEKIATLNAFDAAGRLVKTVADAGGANESATSYAHDANGNLIEQTDATGRKVKFAYDALNRRVAS